MFQREKNSNMTYKGRPIQKIFSFKDYHLSNNSIAMFAANICDSMNQDLDFASAHQFLQLRKKGT